MKDETKTFISATIAAIIVIGIIGGVYYGFKWKGEDLEELKKHCPENTKLTDYTFGNGFNKGTQIFQIECNNNVMNYDIKVNEYKICKEYDKWRRCIVNRIGYNSTKLFANEVISE